jgi:hypothetical protein
MLLLLLLLFCVCNGAAKPSTACGLTPFPLSPCCCCCCVAASFALLLLLLLCRFALWTAVRHSLLRLDHQTSTDARLLLLICQRLLLLLCCAWLLLLCCCCVCFA